MSSAWFCIVLIFSFAHLRWRNFAERDHVGLCSDAFRLARENKFKIALLNVVCLLGGTACSKLKFRPFSKQLYTDLNDISDSSF